MTLDQAFQVELDDDGLSLEALCRLACVSSDWVVWRVQAGLLGQPAGSPQAWRFDAVALARVRRLAVVERGFDATPELAALVADLEDEIARLRESLRRSAMP